MEHQIIASAGIRLETYFCAETTLRTRGSLSACALKMYGSNYYETYCAHYYLTIVQIQWILLLSHFHDIVSKAAARKVLLKGKALYG